MTQAQLRVPVGRDRVPPQQLRARLLAQRHLVGGLQGLLELSEIFLLDAYQGGTAGR